MFALDAAAKAAWETYSQWNHNRMAWEDLAPSSKDMWRDMASVVLRTHSEALKMANVWGTDKRLINADEFCVECEREVPFHYDNCPTRKR